MTISYRNEVTKAISFIFASRTIPVFYECKNTKSTDGIANNPVEDDFFYMPTEFAIIRFLSS